MNKLNELFEKFFGNLNPKDQHRIKIFLIAFFILIILIVFVRLNNNQKVKHKRLNKKNLYNLTIIPPNLRKDIEKHKLIYKVKIIQSEQKEIKEKLNYVQSNLNKINKKLKLLLIKIQKTDKLNRKLFNLSIKLKSTNKELNKIKIIAEQLAGKSKNEKLKKLLLDNRTFSQRIKERRIKQYYTPINNPQKLYFPEMKINKNNIPPETNNPPQSQQTKNNTPPQTISTKINVFKPKTFKYKYKTIVKRYSIKINAGSLIPGVLLTGLDAPTAGSAQSNPVPVLIKIEKDAIMPNRYRMNIKGCFIIAGGYGDLSTGRAMIRTQTLSCITNDGKSIEVPLEGHIIDMDGKMGLRGRLVSKSGQLLAKSLLAGFISGIAKIFRPQFIPSISVEPSSKALFQTPRISDVFLSGTLSGTSNALEKIADYYMKLAEKIFPVIEIQAGRPVEIFILRGQKLITRIKKIRKLVKVR